MNATEAETHEILLPEKLNSAAAANLKSSLQEAVGSPVQLDATSTVVLGAQCLQVLIAAHAKWVADGNDFQTRHVSEPIIQTLDLLGIGHELIGLEEISNGS